MDATLRRERAESEISAIEAELDALGARRYLAELKDSIALSDFGTPVLQESYEPRLAQDNPTETAFLRGEYAYLPTRRDDQTDGRLRPLYETEQELDWYRGISRFQCALMPAMKNALESLDNYTIGEGYSYDVTLAPDAPEGLGPHVEAVLKAFKDDNDWQFLERELHHLSHVDGELFVRCIPWEHWRTRVRLVLPEHVTEPRNGRQLEDWLGIGDCVSSWSFGVHTHDDPQTPLGFHVVTDYAGRDWHYYPVEAERFPMLAAQDRTEVLHFKRNVPRYAKRGVPDSAPIWRFVERAEKLLRNTSVGAAIQSAIAFVKQAAEGVTQAQAEGMRTANKWRSYSRYNADGDARTHYQALYEPGTVPIMKGFEYKAGPLGSERAPNFLAVFQAVMRYVGIIWQMPEFLISGDASNQNYASSLVAEAPFVKSREADQRQYGRLFYLIVWKALRIAFDGGAFAKFNLDWKEFERIVEIEVTPPEVATRDKAAEANSQIQLVSSGLKTVKTARAELGLDHDTEERNAIEAGGGASTLQLSGIQITTAKDVLRDVSLGATAPPAAIELLMALGIPDASAKRMVADTLKFEPRVILDAQGDVIQGAAAEGEEQAVPPDEGPTGEFSTMSRLQQKRNMATLDDILSQVERGEISDVRAVALLQSIGVPAKRAADLVADAKPKSPIAPPATESTHLSPAMRGIAAGLLEDETDLGRVAEVLEEVAGGTH